MHAVLKTQMHVDPAPGNKGKRRPLAFNIRAGPEGYLPMTRKSLNGLFNAMRVNRRHGTSVRVRENRVSGSFTYDVDGEYGVSGDQAKHRVISTLCPGTDYRMHHRVGDPALKWGVVKEIVECIGGRVERTKDGVFIYSM